MKTVVLAYSGGLDTSVCIPLLKERYDYDKVITVVADVGQPASEIDDATRRAETLADAHYTLDLKEEFVEEYLFPSIKANGLYEGYVLGTALARPLIAKKISEVAETENAEALAHGCTGKGNDQLRFEVIFRATDLDVVAPMRDLNLSREWEIDYARDHNIPVTVSREKIWSVDENLWSRSIEGGKLEDPYFIPPEEIYEWTVSPEDKDAPASEIIELAFEDGVPVALNASSVDGVALIRELNTIGGAHGIGRSDNIEDRVLGLKAREIYEHPAATILLTAHRDLESLVLTRDELRFKAIADATWAELAYEGLVDEPLYADLCAFVDATQKRVTGDVKVRLYAGSATVVARRSDFALYSEELVSFGESVIDQRDSEGFSKYHGFQARLVRK
ncbi:MAG: argininosuccinate synthase [Candidatus Methanogaster sp.]|uniref:Argininosuccinate synthase n=1 Tax=Candidatus Methanogaster sp. TaxID=3386292 RepID=A0AC61L191_9EURY|nr:MAG: argininosuccinate synthase [ANME-2 cluster archaeon]